jgi:hypothetical protein
MLRTITIILSTLLFSLTATAHHSFPAQYDINQSVELSGTVTEVQWTNPHIFIMVDVVDEESGETVNWILELGGPNTLLRLGWKRDSLKMDDRIQVEGSLARNGSALVNATTIIMEATGRRMLAGSSRDDQ